MPRLSLVVCLLLVATAATQLHFGVAPVPAVGTPAGVAAVVEREPLPRFALAPLATLTETVERPLFMPTRRPSPPPPPVVVEAAPVVAAPEPPPPQPPQVGKFVLSAVVIAGDERREAIIRNPQTGREERLREGQEIAQWTLREVRADAVTLGWRDVTQEVPLRTFADAPPPPPSTVQIGQQERSADAAAAQRLPTRRQLTPAQLQHLDELRERRRQRREALLRAQQARQSQ